MLIPLMLRKSATVQKQSDTSVADKLRKARENEKIQVVIAMGCFIVISIICSPTIVAIAASTQEPAQKKWLLAMGLGVLIDLTIYQFLKVLFHLVILIILGGEPITSVSKARICIIKVMDRSVLRPFFPRIAKISASDISVNSQVKDANMSMNASNMAINAVSVVMNESALNQSPEKTSPEKPIGRFILEDSEFKDASQSLENKEHEQSLDVSEIKVIPELSNSSSFKFDKKIVHRTGETVYLDNSFLQSTSNVLNIRSIMSIDINPANESIREQE